MSDCCSPSDYGELFDEKSAARSLKHYRAKGLDKMAQLLFDYLQSRDLDGRTVLEVGGGIGALHVELLNAGAAT